MSVNDQSTASRQFVASAAAYSSKWIKGTRYWQVGYTVFFVAFVAFAVLTVFGPLWGVHVHVPKPSAAVVYGVLAGMMAAGVGIAAHLFWRSRRKYLITVTSDVLTVNPRRGAYSIADARLGLWVHSGVALQLRSGRHRFVLGGRDRRVGPATPLDTPPVPLVDAWLPESDFDELLRLGGRSAARGPAPGEPSRCVLFPNPLSIQRMGSFAFRKTQRLMRSLNQPQLFVDVDNDAIRVLDPNSNAVNASASASQVTATPATYQLSSGHWFPSAQNVASDAAGQYFSTMPAVAVSVPGMQPLTIGCRDFRGLKRRFSWSGNVPVHNDPPAYAVSAADWLTLVETFGLAPQLQDSTE
jgi:hypothetical protein